MRSNLLPFAARVAVIISATSLCANARGAEPPPTPEARTHFNAGISHLDRRRYAEAYREFKAAYAITPRWTILGNLGIAAEHLQRDGEAIGVMDEYLERGGAEIDDREFREVRSAIQRLKKGTASVSLQAPGRFWVVDTRLDADHLQNEYGPFDDQADIQVRAGQHEFRLERATIDAPAWRANLVPGDVAVHAFEVEPPAPHAEAFNAVPAMDPETPREPSHAVSYLLWGVGGVGAVATVFVALHASNLQNEADADFAQNCQSPSSNDETCQVTTEVDRKAAHWRTAALATGAGAFGALVGGTVLYFLSNDSPSNPSEASVRPLVSPAGIGVTGTF